MLVSVERVALSAMKCLVDYGAGIDCVSPEILLPRRGECLPFTDAFDLVCSCSLCTQSSVRANQKFVETMLGHKLVGERCARDGANKSQRNAENARILGPISERKSCHELG